MDIRNFFPSASGSKSKTLSQKSPITKPTSKETKKRSPVVSAKVKTRKRKIIISDSESDEEPVSKPSRKISNSNDSDVEILDCSPDVSLSPKKPAKNSSSDAKKRIIEKPKDKNANESKIVEKSPKQTIKAKEVLKPAQVSEFFSKNPVKRSTFRVVEKIEKKDSPPVVHSIKNSIDPEFDIHDDDDFERTLLLLDDLEQTGTSTATVIDKMEIPAKKIKIDNDDFKNDKIKKSKKEIPEKIDLCNTNGKDDVKDIEPNKKNTKTEKINKLNESVETKKEEVINTKKVTPEKINNRKTNGKETLKETVTVDVELLKQKNKNGKIDVKLNQSVDNKEPEVGKSPEEKRREHFLGYQHYLQRDGPRALGSKEKPEGEEGCLQGLTFLVTGILESMERDETKELIENYGGKMMSTLSKNTNYLIVGRDAGPSKLEKAEKLKTKQLTEDELFELIKTRPASKSGKALSTKKSKKSLETPVSPSELKPKKKNEIESPIQSTSPKTEHTNLKTTEKNEITPKKTSPVAKIEEKTSKNGFKSFKSTKINLEASQIDSKTKKEAHIDVKTNVTPQMSPSQPGSSKKTDLNGETLMWVDKYKPASLKQLIGQQGDRSNAKKLLDWLLKWHKNQMGGTKKAVANNKWGNKDDGSASRAVLLSGSPGVGKTTTAQLACKEANFTFVEMNASDTRSKKNLQEEVSQLLQNKTINSNMNEGPNLLSKHVIIMDEVDGMSGNEDRGGTQELIALIKTSRIPIICICNDRAHPKIRSLSNYCFDLRFQKPRVEQIKGAMMSIAFKEGFKIPPNTLSEMINASNQDIRQVLHNLSLWSARIKNGSLATETEGKYIMPTKDIKLGPFEVLRKVFSTDEAASSIHEKSSLFFHDYSLAPLFVQENYLQVQPRLAKGNIIKQLELISQTADSIRDGDLTDKIIRSRNNWSLLPVAAMYSSVLPGDYMRGHLTGMINFPAWLGKNSTRNHMDRILQQLQMHMRLRISGNKTELNTQYLPLLRDNLTRPLVERENDGVKDVIRTMESYYLMREDLESIGELTTWSGKKDPMSNVNPKVKAALTRTFNKEGFLNPYSIVTIKKSRKEPSLNEDGLEDELGPEDEEEDDNIDIDAMIKKVKTASKSKKTTAGPSTSGSKPTRGRGKGKK